MTFPTFRVLLPLVLVAGFALLRPGVGGAQVSPGPLASPHASLDSPLECLKCHAQAASKKGMEERCLSCHKEIAWMRTQQRGAHAKVVEKDCYSCHPEHGGRDFKLIAWEEGSPEKFDHKRAGYTLEGKHATLECRKCHTPALEKSPVVPLMQRKDHSQSWLGMQPTCAGCHKDFHRGQLGTDCLQCHAQDAWKPAKGFDHAKSRFPLTGLHVKVECAKCHASKKVATELDEKGLPLAVWKPLPHADCVDCHADKHEGRFKGACAKCHSTDSFKNINRLGFNHDETRYPLHGKHVTVQCQSCHDAKTAFGPKPKFAQCTNCHRDLHNGLATLAGKVVDCASCHEVTGFHPSTFTVEAHQKSAYPLEGRHATADCSLCHAKLAADSRAAAGLGKACVVLRPKKGACTDCHTDPHAGRFNPTGARPKKNGCLTCHGMSGFRPSKYDNRMHLDCVFPLDGAHRATPCQACHEELKAAPSKATLAADSSRMRPLHFDNPRRVCVDCHTSPHGTQFATRKDKGACQGCHGVDAFTPAVKFDHNRDARFKLEGAHAKTLCTGCHVPQKDASGKPFTIYRPTPMTCESCHAAGLRDSTAVPRPKAKARKVESRIAPRMTTRPARPPSGGRP